LIRGSRHNVLTVSVPPPPVFVLNLKGGDVLSNLDRLYEFQRVGPVHAADLCGRVTAMWLRIRRW
jgi:hypothetical protein